MWPTVIKWTFLTSPAIQWWIHSILKISKLNRLKKRRRHSRRKISQMKSSRRSLSSVAINRWTRNAPVQLLHCLPARTRMCKPNLVRSAMPYQNGALKCANACDKVIRPTPSRVQAAASTSLWFSNSHSLYPPRERANSNTEKTCQHRPVRSSWPSHQNRSQVFWGATHSRTSTQRCHISLCNTARTPKSSRNLPKKSAKSCSRVWDRRTRHHKKLLNLRRVILN